jgi:hypothetical protein
MPQGVLGAPRSINDKSAASLRPLRRQAVVVDRSLDNLVEEQLIGLADVGPEAPVQLEPLVVDDEALDDELAQGPGRPDAELGGLRAVDPVADRDDLVEVVKRDFAPDLAIALALNSPNSSESCRHGAASGSERAPSLARSRHRRSR